MHPVMADMAFPIKMPVGVAVAVVATAIAVAAVTAAVIAIAGAAVTAVVMAIAGAVITAGVPVGSVVSSQPAPSESLRLKHISRSSGMSWLLSPRRLRN